MNLKELQERLEHQFKNKKLLVTSLTHPSFWREKKIPAGKTKTHYQRLEFLGDAVLGCILSSYLFTLYPRQNEGFLSKAHSILSRREFLVKLAYDLEIPKYICAGPMELKNLPPSIVEDVFEALIGAVFLDAGFEKTSTLIPRWFGDIKTQLNRLMIKDNPKGQLQELVGASAGKLNYKLTNATGPTHARLFEVELYFEDNLCGRGQGKTKKQAENLAAEEALKLLKKGCFNF